MREKDHDYLIDLGNIELWKEADEHYSRCFKNDSFNYCGIEKALCGKLFDMEKRKGKYFTPKRFVVIQMK